MSDPRTARQAGRRVPRQKTARETLRGLTVPAAAVFVVLALLTALLQIPRWLLAVAAEIAEVVVIAGQAAQDHIAGAPVAVVTTVPLRPHRSAGGVW